MPIAAENSSRRQQVGANLYRLSRASRCTACLRNINVAHLWSSSCGGENSQPSTIKFNCLYRHGSRGGRNTITFYIHIDQYLILHATRWRGVLLCSKIPLGSRAQTWRLWVRIPILPSKYLLVFSKVSALPTVS